LGDTEEWGAVQEGVTIWMVKEGDEKCFSDHMVTETFFIVSFSSPPELQNIFQHLLSLTMWLLHIEYQSSLWFHSIMSSPVTQGSL
jgi:hypothetical protein